MLCFVCFSAQSTSTSENTATETHLIVGLSVAALLVFVFAAVSGYLIFKIRRLTKKRSNHPRAIFNNRAYCADSERKVDDDASINDVVDLAMIASRGANPNPSIYENPSRPLPPVPQTSNTNAGPPCSSARQTTGNHFDNGTKPGQAERHYMGLTKKNENNFRPFAPEPSNYMSLSPERPEAGSYAALAAARPQTPRKPRHETNKRKRQGKDSET